MLVGSQSEDSEDGNCTEHGAYSIHVNFALTGDGGCIARARDHATDFLTRLRDRHGLDVSPYTLGTTQLVVSELVTNAVKYAPGPVFMELRVADARVEVVVRDSDSSMPSAQPTDPDRVGRHGLEIVRAVTQDLDIRRQAVGKRITARIALSAAPAAPATPAALYDVPAAPAAFSDAPVAGAADRDAP